MAQIAPAELPKLPNLGPLPRPHLRPRNLLRQQSGQAWRLVEILAGQASTASDWSLKKGSCRERARAGDIARGE